METYRYTAVGLSSCREVAMPQVLDPAALAADTDASLDRNLTRLYRLHLAADDEGRDECHAAIMDVLGEMGARLDVWLNDHRASA